MINNNVSRVTTSNGETELSLINQAKVFPVRNR